ncbi:cation-transporting P-type ATPase [Streptomyces sp. NPDC054840]
MTVRSDSVEEQPRAAGDGWYPRSPEEVVAAFHADPAVGLSAARAAELLAAHGPNALPEEQRTPSWRRFLARYRSLVALAPLALAVLVTQLDGFQRVLGTTEIDARQFGRALPAAVALLLVRELGKLMARRSRPS